jgi:hypothetical protein
MKPITKIAAAGGLGLATSLFMGVELTILSNFSGGVIFLATIMTYWMVGSTTIILLFLTPENKPKRKRRHQSKLIPENESVLSIEPISSGRAG